MSFLSYIPIVGQVEGILRCAVGDHQGGRQALSNAINTTSYVPVLGHVQAATAAIAGRDDIARNHFNRANAGTIAVGVTFATAGAATAVAGAAAGGLGIAGATGGVGSAIVGGAGAAAIGHTAGHATQSIEEVLWTPAKEHEALKKSFDEFTQELLMASVIGGAVSGVGKAVGNRISSGASNSAASNAPRLSKSSRVVPLWPEESGGGSLGAGRPKSGACGIPHFYPEESQGGSLLAKRPSWGVRRLEGVPGKKFYSIENFRRPDLQGLRCVKPKGAAKIFCHSEETCFRINKQVIQLMHEEGVTGDVHIAAGCHGRDMTHCPPGSFRALGRADADFFLDWKCWKGAPADMNLIIHDVSTPQGLRGFEAARRIQNGTCYFDYCFGAYNELAPWRSPAW